MKFQFIEDHMQEYAVKTICRALSVSECGYSAWRKRPKREQQNEELTHCIQQIFEHNRQIYGVRAFMWNATIWGCNAHASVWLIL